MSTVSKFVIRGDTSPTFAEHLVHYGSVEENDETKKIFEEDLFPNNAMTHIFEQGSYFGSFPCGRKSSKTRAWLLIAPAPFEISPPDNTVRSEEDLVDDLREKTSKFSPEVLEAILSTPLHRIKTSGLYYRVPHHKWFRENVVLIGDAVHSPLPYTGQGANLAMEDAFVLAQALSRNEANNYLAFKEYQDARMERCSRIVRLGDLFSRVDVAENNTMQKLRTPFRPHDLHNNDSGHMHPTIPLLKMLEDEIVDDNSVPLDPCIEFVR